MRINYLLAAWSGMRRINPKKYIDDRSCYLRKHIERLKTLRHDLEDITIIVPENPKEPPSYKEYIDSLPVVIQGARVSIFRRPNVGYSYGGYSEVYRKTRGMYDHYILMEDDYIFCLNNFDVIMKDLLSKDDGCGAVTFCLKSGTKEWLINRIKRECPEGEVVASYVERFCPDKFLYPQVCLAIIRAVVLEDLFNAYGELPHSKKRTHEANKFEGQFGLMLAIQKIGWRLRDAAEDYRVVEFESVGAHLKEYGPKDKPIIVRPAQQAIERPGLMH